MRVVALQGRARRSRRAGDAHQHEPCINGSSGSLGETALDSPQSEPADDTKGSFHDSPDPCAARLPPEVVREVRRLLCRILVGNMREDPSRWDDS